MTAMGGGQKPAMARQHCRYAESAMLLLSRDGDLGKAFHESPSDDTTVIKRLHTLWVEPTSATVSPSTTIARIMSLQGYLRYLLVGCKNELRERGASPDTIRLTIDGFKPILSTIRRQRKQRETLARETEDSKYNIFDFKKKLLKMVPSGFLRSFYSRILIISEQMMTQAHLLEFEGTPRSRSALKLLGAALDAEAGSQTPSVEERTIVRDFIITMINIGTAQRSGVYKNMTIGELDGATLERDKMIILVSYNPLPFIGVF